MIGQLEIVIGAVVAALIAFGTMLFKARQAGKAEAERDQMARDLQAIRTAEDVERAVAGQDIDKSRKELGQWARR